jgi:protein O-GlcNAc transferase
MTTPDAHTLYTQSLTWFAEGKTDLALNALQQSVKQVPDNAVYALQLAAFQRECDRLDDARNTLSQALLHCPAHAQLNYELGCLFHVAGQLDHALNYYRQALKLNPKMAAGWHQLGRLLQQLERNEQATDAFGEALALEPNNARFANSAGLHFYFLDQAEQARECFTTALQSSLPIERRGHYLLNAAMAYLLSPLALKQALQCLGEACTLNEAYIKEVQRIGAYFFHLRNYLVAEPFFRLALHYASEADTCFDLHVKLASCYERLCYLQSSLDHYQEALAIRPDRWLLEIQAGLLLPMIYETPESIFAWRDRFALNLNNFLARSEAAGFPRSVQSLEIYAPPFLLAYQGLNHKKLLTLLSQFWRDILHLSPLPPEALERKPTSSQPQRRKIAFLSSFLFKHSVTGAYLGLVETWARRQDVELLFFSVGQLRDDEITAYLRSVGTYHLLDPGTPLVEMAQQVLQATPDILLYPEVGSDPITYFLAHARLAPVQAAMYGHPATTGISTLDYFLSPGCTELPAAQDHYTEQLVCLPNAPFVYRHETAVTPFERKAFGLLPEHHLYVIPSALFKVHPEMDSLLARIAAQDNKAVFCFIEAPGTRWHEVLRQRLLKVLPENSLCFLPYLEQPHFFGLLQAADVLMDTLHFCSGNVSYQCFALELPLITLPGQLMRSRTTAGLYQIMEIEDCTAENASHFVDLCIRMAHDPTFKPRVQQQIRERAHRLWDIEADLETACRRIEDLYAAH